jgi:hypothetical protein
VLLIGLNITVVLCSVLIALLSLVGGYPNMHRYFSKVRFPSSRFYINVLNALDKLESLSETEKYENVDKEYKYGSVQRGDMGFDELVKILKENNMAKGEIQKISLLEVEQGLIIGDVFPKIARYLEVEKHGGIKETIRTDPFDPAKPIRELKEAAEAITRRQLVSWIITLVVIWLTIQTCLICMA